MRTVKCKSGISGWRCRLQKNYSSFEEFENYDALYDLAKRLGYSSAKIAWERNPVIEGSVEPSDFRKVKE